MSPSDRAQGEDCYAILEQREEIAQRPADDRPKAVSIDVTNLLRDGAAAASPVWTPAFAGARP